jgi:hypothetical protein
MGGRPGTGWGATFWSILQVKTKCDGATPFAGPIPTRWRVDIKNLAKEPVYLDYLITLANAPQIQSNVVSRRIMIKAGSIKGLAVDMETDCGGTIVTVIRNVRLGTDSTNVPYLPPDRSTRG